MEDIGKMKLGGNENPQKKTEGLQASTERDPKTKLEVKLQELERGRRYGGQLNFGGRKFNYTIALNVSIDDIINDSNIDRDKLAKIFPIACSESSGEPISLDRMEHGYLLATLLPHILNLYDNPQAKTIKEEFTNVLSPALFAHRDRDIITGPIIAGLDISQDVSTDSVPKRFLSQTMNGEHEMPLSQSSRNSSNIENRENPNAEWGPEFGHKWELGINWNNAQEKLVELNSTLKEGEKPWRLPTIAELDKAIQDDVPGFISANYWSCEERLTDNDKPEMCALMFNASTREPGQKGGLNFKSQDALVRVIR